MKPATIISRLSIPLFVGCGLIASFVAEVSGHSLASHQILFVVLIVGSTPLLVDIVQALKERHFGVDIIAIVAIITSLLVGQYLAGTVILLMLSGGEALEEFALKRARKELTDLLSRAPRIAHCKTAEGLKDLPVDDVQIGDLVLVKPGEVIPVDGEVHDGSAMVDESALTGESVPVQRTIGQRVMSGSVATDAVLTICTLVPSSQSTYAHIVRLVREAEDQKAPFVRLADRYSVWFTSVAFILALLAWFLSHDPIRLLAVLVVATPCPLILATPIAFAAGISRAAKRGIIIRNGGALEKLGEARSLVFDKTGTMTLGTPTLIHIEAFGTKSKEEILQISASIDQYSAHILAKAICSEARKRSIQFETVNGFSEAFGEGVTASVRGSVFALGRLSFLQSRGVSVSVDQIASHDQAREQGKMVVYIAEEKNLIGAIYFADQLRSSAKHLFQSLPSLGISTIRMLTGDKRAVAMPIAQSVGLSEADVRAECLPQDKVSEVKKLKESSGPVVMVGDGINDAPALATADVGIAMGAGGSTAASQAGDLVIMVDDIGRVGEALCIGHRVLRIALESIIAGIGLSILLMILAAFGYISPVYGAMLQEVIDVVVILNALRVLLVRCEI